MPASTSPLPSQLSERYEGRSALRMLVGALGAYVRTSIIHLPGPYSAVITTLIVARPHCGGVLRASFERLTATGGSFPGDPADRLIVGAALEMGVPVVTRDQRISDWGHVQTIW